MDKRSQCAKCGLSRKDSLCHNPDGVAPAFCATKNCGDVIARSEELYQEEEIRRFAAEAARQSASRGIRDPETGALLAVKPRMQEIIEFCRRMNYTHLGLAFCGALRPEGKAVGALLEKRGFQVTSVMCKVGGLDRACVGVCAEEGEKQPPLCNPIGQALILNEAGTEFNILLGLCVGHDSLFLKYAQAMCTVFAVKDRVTGHNPLAAIYTLDTLYSRLKED